MVIKLKLNKIQSAAFDLIQADARFIYTLTDISQNAKNIDSNYIMMCQPYIGIFADGAEQWCKKVGFNAPRFNKEEKIYYTALRQSHKLLERTYSEYSSLLINNLTENDDYFYNNRSLREKLLGYNNVGVDKCNNEFCGNTIICSTHTPIAVLGNENAGISIKDLSVIAGKLAAYFGCLNFPPYRYNDNIVVKYDDYHFYKNCPLKLKTDLGFVLFSILCSINYTTVFIDKYFTEEIPQKFKFAYLQYYYLCDFIKEVNTYNGTNYYLNESLKNWKLRNCLSHYGLGQFLDEIDIIDNDILKGLTNKTFGMDYNTSKKLLYKYLNDLTERIKNDIF